MASEYRYYVVVASEPIKRAYLAMASQATNVMLNTIVGVTEHTMTVLGARCCLFGGTPIDEC